MGFDSVNPVIPEGGAGKAMETVITKLRSMDELEQGEGLKPFVMIDGFGTSIINLGIFYRINSHRQNRSVVSVKKEAMAAGLAALTRSGFSLPADIVELKIYQEGQPIPIWLKQDAEPA